MQYKRCSKGDDCCHPNGPVLPADTENFNRNRHSLDGLTWQCRECAKAYSRQYRKQNAEKVRARKLKYYYENQTAQQQKHREWLANNVDYVKAYKQQYRQDKAQQVREYEKRYRQENRKSRNEKSKSWRKCNAHRISEYNRWYFASGRGKAAQERKLARRRELPDTLTADQWIHALDYFNGRCAACGRPLRDLFGTHTAAMDHWIPLSSPGCPGTIATNIVPLCHGEAGCNNSKCNRDAAEWLTEKFGKRKAREILQRIEAYFQWVSKDAD